ncbi:hypothetical protein [Portibacter lacus]|uniref:Uncharacterized protein n=1 Tax=Portibacter lacus TaxID=1099794 RepID=A0AA37WDB7_9BACT|nr:hypothetical protein [Portibacter lacus]GLR16693.1 hypothetical protein GCM10007940_13080 [Portibacter lacus]
MGDQKDHVTIQKKDVESASQEVETQNYEMATESIAPPSLQLKAEETKEDKDVEKSSEGESAFQFSLDGPPDNPSNESSRTFGSDTVQGKGIAEPFKIPIIQKKEVQPQVDRDTQKQSFKL